MNAPNLTNVVSALAGAIQRGIEDVRALAAKAPDAGTAAALNGLAVRLEELRDSTDLATIRDTAIAEIKQALLTGKSVIRHDPTDVY